MHTRQILIVLAALTTAGSVASHAQSPSPAPVSATPSIAPAAHKLVLPLLPADLLGLLPKTPDKWQLNQSQASNFVMDWASTRAIREFTYTPPPTDTASPGVAPLPLDLRISITDTGYYQGLIGDFDGSPAPKGSAVESLVLNDFPARQVAQGKTGERLRVLVNGRYIVQIEVQNQPANSTQQWLKLVNLTKIAALPTDGEETLPRPYTVIRIDEMNPRNNSVSKVTFATQEEADRTAKRRH